MNGVPSRDEGARSPPKRESVVKPYSHKECRSSYGKSEVLAAAAGGTLFLTKGRVALKLHFHPPKPNHGTPSSTETVF